MTNQERRELVAKLRPQLVDQLLQVEDAIHEQRRQYQRALDANARAERLRNQIAEQEQLLRQAQR